MLRTLREVVPERPRAGRRRRQPRRHRRRRRGARRGPRRDLGAAPRRPRTGWAARTARASRGASSAATTTSSRSTATSPTTRAPCPTLLDAPRRPTTSSSGRATSPAGTIPSWPIPRLWLSRGGNQYASVMLGLRVEGLDRRLPGLLARRAGQDRLRHRHRRRLRLPDRDDVPSATGRRVDHRGADLLHRPHAGRVQDVQRDRRRGAVAGHQVGARAPLRQGRPRPGRPAPRSGRWPACRGSPRARRSGRTR